MTDKQITIDEMEINPNDWLEPYKPIPACEIKDCNHLVYAGNNVYGCRIAEDGLVCDDFNNDDECCMYRQLEYYKETLKAKEQRIVEHNKTIKAKEQECEELKKIINEAKNSKLDLNSFFAIEATVGEYQLELDQLKAEVKSKTEYIQEQRDIINQYSKEIEMYKKCQGKRASKREEELKAENKHLNDLLNQALKELEKTRETLTEIKEIAEVNSINTCWTAINLCVDCDEIKECGLQSPFEKLKAIIQKISEVIYE